MPKKKSKDNKETKFSKAIRTKSPDESDETSSSIYTFEEKPKINKKKSSLKKVEDNSNKNSSRSKSKEIDKGNAKKGSHAKDNDGDETSESGGSESEAEGPETGPISSKAGQALDESRRASRPSTSAKKTEILVKTSEVVKRSHKKEHNHHDHTKYHHHHRESSAEKHKAKSNSNELSNRQPQYGNLDNLRRNKGTNTIETGSVSTEETDSDDETRQEQTVYTNQQSEYETVHSHNHSEESEVDKTKEKASHTVIIEKTAHPEDDGTSGTESTLPPEAEPPIDPTGGFKYPNYEEEEDTHYMGAETVISQLSLNQLILTDLPLDTTIADVHKVFTEAIGIRLGVESRSGQSKMAKVEFDTKLGVMKAYRNSKHKSINGTNINFTFEKLRANYNNFDGEDQEEYHPPSEKVDKGDMVRNWVKVQDETYQPN